MYKYVNIPYYIIHIYTFELKSRTIAKESVLSPRKFESFIPSVDLKILMYLKKIKTI